MIDLSGQTVWLARDVRHGDPAAPNNGCGYVKCFSSQPTLTEDGEWRSRKGKFLAVRSLKDLCEQFPRLQVPMPPEGGTVRVTFPAKPAYRNGDIVGTKCGSRYIVTVDAHGVWGYWYPGDIQLGLDSGLFRCGQTMSNVQGYEVLGNIFDMTLPEWGRKE